MCGIIGVVGRDDALDVIVDGLQRLEYRGYDSAGVALQTGGGGAHGLRVVKRAGKLPTLVAALEGAPAHGRTGLGHTRWATHGAPTDRNAHPHTDPTGSVSVVHNGIIENYQTLKASLDGRSFASDTDTEVVAHLVADAYDGDLLEAVRRVVARLRGAYSLCLVHADEPDVLVAARRASPLIIAHTDGVGYCASDVAALITHTREVAALGDGQLARITPAGVDVVDGDGRPAEPDPYTVTWDVDAAEKQGYPHFMLKEIHEQPQAVADTLLNRRLDGRLTLDELHLDEDEFARLDKVFVVACGTSLYAGMLAKLAVEHWAGIPVEVEVASEFRYRDPILSEHTLVVAISQSGETVDTLAAVSHARDQRAKVAAITNVVGSSLAREADAVLYTHAGPEIGVAASKTFTTQIVAVDLLALYLAQIRRALWPDEVADMLKRLEDLPAQLDEVLAAEEDIVDLARRYVDVPYTMFIGRHASLPIAHEGALKLKEISYLHTEAFPAGEMKHGPIALIEHGSLVVAIAPRGHVFTKMVGNIQEVKARGARVLAIGTKGSTAELEEHADHIIAIPEAHELAAPALAVVPLQLLAYHIATLRGEDVDQPRNLAKTVTVE
ncbi:MAG: glutamine--fructose-6-phosphate transaminase (isomerizing) [Actinomycetota bacterium]|nr:glutamine--fructose-6-phosphate transaminase (isomerizing) [Actinomycetota bacterium]